MKKPPNQVKNEMTSLREADRRRQVAEIEIRNLHQQGEYGHSAVRALELYQDEFTGWLVRRLLCRQRAADVYSDFMVDVWIHWPAFRWECSFRTWAYRILRNKCIDVLRKKDPHVFPSHLSQLEAVAVNRISTYKVPEVEQNYQLLSKEILNEEQRDILTLRVGQAMTWEEIARIISDDLNSDKEQIQRQAARLRQQFKRIKVILRQEAESRSMVREI